MEADSKSLAGLISTNEILLIEMDQHHRLFLEFLILTHHVDELYESEPEGHLDLLRHVLHWANELVVA